MDARNLTELRKANDDNKPNHADKSGGIAVDVLPTGGVLLGTLKIRVLEQMPLRGNPAHPHFIPLLSRPPLRPRNLPQQPHTMKTPTTPQQIDCSATRSLADLTIDKLAAQSIAYSAEEIVDWHILNTAETNGFTEAEMLRFENYWMKGVASDLAVQIILSDRKSNQEGAQ